MDGHLKAGILPTSLFGNGITYFIEQLYKEFNLKPFSAHPTDTPFRMAGKIFRFREALAMGN